MATDDFPAPSEGFLLTHFIVSADVERSRAFYADVLGGEVVLEGEPTIVKLANGWIIINVGGGPHRRQTGSSARHPDRPQPGQQFPQPPGGRHQRCVRAMECPWREVPHSPHRSRRRGPVLHARSRRPPHRSRRGDRRARPVADAHTSRSHAQNSVSTHLSDPRRGSAPPTGQCAGSRSGMLFVPANRRQTSCSPGCGNQARVAGHAAGGD